MTNKQIIYSAHAVGRLKRRRVSRTEVRGLLAVGKREVFLAAGSRTVWVRTGYLGKDKAKVFYLEGRKAIRVITIEFAGKTPRNRRSHPKEKF